MKKGALRNFTKFTGKHLRQSHFIKKETLAQVFFCEFCEISKNTFLQNTSGRLLLNLGDCCQNKKKETSISSFQIYIKFSFWIKLQPKQLFQHLYKLILLLLLSFANKKGLLVVQSRAGLTQGCLRRTKNAVISCSLMSFFFPLPLQ